MDEPDCDALVGAVEPERDALMLEANPDDMLAALEVEEAMLAEPEGTPLPDAEVATEDD